MQNIFVSTIFI